MSNCSWVKAKEKDFPLIEKILRDNEEKYVNACYRFSKFDAQKDKIWLLRDSGTGKDAFILKSKSTLLPVNCGKNKISNLKFLTGFFKQKIHCVQGPAVDVKILEDFLEKDGRIINDIFDYDLMALDLPPAKKTRPPLKNLELCVPCLSDIQALVPLRAGYEKEEVLPRGSEVNLASCALAIAGFIYNERILAAKLDGRFVGKIIVNAVSFTRCQIGGVYVDPAFRGRGIASRMTAEFVSSLIKEGRGVTLFVKKNNIPAKRLYTGIGFQVRGDYRITYY